MFASVLNKIRELFGKMNRKTISNVLDVKPSVSEIMIDAMKIWRAIYENRASWIKEPTEKDPERVVSLGLGKQIASEKARLVCLEMKSEITAPKEENKKIDSDTGLSYVEFKSESKDISRAEYLNKQYNDTIIKNLRSNLEYGIALGTLVFKPYVSNGEFACDFVQADDFVPLSFNSRGEMTEAAFIERIVREDVIYSRVEHHKWINGIATVTNRTFKTEKTITQSEELGKEISISSVPEWSMLVEKAEIPSEKPLFACFKMPIANNVDSHCNLGMSVYGGGTEKLIKDADEQYSRMNWEFEGGELAIDVDSTVLNDWKDEDGNIRKGIPSKQRRLMRMNDFDENTTSYNVYNPSFRDISLINGLNAIKREIEGKCELAPGTLSDPNTVAKTAEEIRSGKPASVTSTIEIQTALQDTLEHVVYIMNIYADLYNLVEKGNYEVSFEWGNGLKEDPEKETSRRLNEIDRGLSTDVDYLEYEYGLTRKQAIDRVKEVQAYNAWKARANAQNDIGSTED